MALLIVLSLLLLTQDKPTEKPQDKPPEKCSLSGTVVDSITGEPLNKVALWLEPFNGEAATLVTTTSDAKGHFALVDLGAGAYRLRGRRSGYLEGLYGARRPGGNGTVARLEAGQALSDLNLKLTPAGAIAGTIRDSDGEPIEYASVELGQIVYSNRGRPRLESAGYTMTDDRGEYRFHGLASGKYYISAVYRSSVFGQVDGSASTGPTDASVATFYPGAPDSATASPVEVSAGVRIAGIDVMLLRLRVVCVSGRVAVMPQSGRRSVSLETANAPIGTYRESTSVKNAAGDFQFCRVPPGLYVLSAYADTLSARVRVNVGSVDVNDIRVTLSPGAEIRGRVQAEGQEKPSLKDVAFEISQDGKWLARGNALADGTFTIENWRPDHYDVGIPTTPHGFYVKSIRSGEADVLADGLAISGPGTVPLDVVISPDGSKLSGVVVDKDQQPVAGSTVLLVPDQRSRLDLFKNTTSDQRGHFEFTALAPGSYKLFAWDDVRSNEWYDPDFLKDYEKQAEKAVLEPKAHATVSLHMAVPPDAQ